MLPLDQNRSLALNRILLGEIEALQERSSMAEQHWKEAAAVAKRLHDRPLAFKAEFLLYKLAKQQGNLPTARALQRRLRRLTPWLPPDTPELVEFKQLAP
jgi:hypothetical protein